MFDLGNFAKLVSEDEESFNKDECVGTPGYAAPEIVQGLGHGLSADVYSLGVFVSQFLLLDILSLNSDAFHSRLGGDQILSGGYNFYEECRRAPDRRPTMEQILTDGSTTAFGENFDGNIFVTNVRQRISTHH